MQETLAQQSPNTGHFQPLRAVPAEVAPHVVSDSLGDGVGCNLGIFVGGVGGDR